MMSKQTKFYSILFHRSDIANEWMLNVIGLNTYNRGMKLRNLVETSNVSITSKHASGLCARASTDTLITKLKSNG